MCTSYLAACEPQITRKESTRRDERIKMQTENAPDIGITQRDRSQAWDRRPLGMETLWHECQVPIDT
jgi:hypothetical protein